MKTNIKVTILPENAIVNVREGISAKGNPYKLLSQVGWIFLNARFPVEFKIRLNEGQLAYPAGDYFLGSSSLKIGGYGDITSSDSTMLHPADGK